MTILKENIIFEALNGRKFRFVSMYDSKTIKVWEITRLFDGTTQENLGGIKVKDIDTQTLKDIGVWDLLEDGIKNSTTNKDEEGINMGRRSKHIGVPKELVCIKCGAKVVIAPSVLVARVEKLGKSVEGYVNTYECQKCNNTRGRRVNPNAPSKVDLVCKCGVKVSYPACIVKKQAEKKGLTVEQHIAKYACQKCVPTKGRPKKVVAEVIVTG